MLRAKKIKFTAQPIVIGDLAMEYHKLSMPNEHIETYLLVSPQDFETLLTIHDKKESPYGIYVMDAAAVCYFLNWYGYNYENVAPKAIKMKGKLIADKYTLLTMATLLAMDKKNKILKSTAKKYLADASIIVNSLI